MAKRKLLIAAAILSVIVLSLALAACGPTPFDSMSSVQREYYEKYGESATALGPDGLVLYKDKETELFGYLDATSGKVVIEAKYADAGKFAGGMAVVDAGNRNVSVIDKSGKTLLTGLTEECYIVADKIIGNKDDKWGVWNNKGEAVIPAEYDVIMPIYDAPLADKEDIVRPICGTFIVGRGDKIALADVKGKMLSDFIYEDIGQWTGDYIPMIREDGGVDFVNMASGKVADTRYDNVDLMYIGFDRYLIIDGNTGIFVIVDEKLEELRRLPDGSYPAAEELVDKNTCFVFSSSGTHVYFLDIKSGDLTPATATAIGDSANYVIAYKNGDNWDVYGNGEVVASVPEAELDYCSIVSGTFRDYMFNTATNTLTDLLTGESVKLSREVTGVTDAEEGMFVVQNKAGKLAACAKNGTLLTEFCFDEMTAYSDGFVGYRGGVCEWYGTEGNLILRSNDKSIG